MERISSRQNALVKRFRALAHAGSNDEDILLDGPHLLDEALDSAIEVRVTVFAESAVKKRLATLAERARRAGVRTVVAGDSLFGALTPVREPSGVVSIALRPAMSIVQTLERAPQLVLVLEGVQDPGNVGAIVRAAEACGATAVIVGAGSADPFGWKALRGAMGSSFRLPVTRAPLPDILRALRSAQIRLFATVPRGGHAPAHVDLRRPSAIVLGGEGGGVSGTVIDEADERLTLPMQPPVESLNVAIAAALVLYEASRQRTDVAVR